MSAATRETKEIVRDEMSMHGPILVALRDGPLTVPEIAAAIGAPSHEVVIWVMGMRRFGWLREVKGSADDGYFRYELGDRS
jgi:hypothetical protein